MYIASYNQGIVLLLILDINRRLCLSQFLPESLSCVDLKKIFWISIITRPIPNSTADNTRNKNVKDNKFTLSKIKPTDKTTTYNVIHSNSAVNRRCNAFETLKAILKNIKKKSMKYKFISPINIINYK